MIEWATVTNKRKVVYYVPWNTPVDRDLKKFAKARGVTIEVRVVR